MKMNKKILICVVLLLLGLLGWQYWHHTTYIKIQSEYMRRDMSALILTSDQLPNEEQLQQLTALEYLDVRSVDLSIEEYERLRTLLPECRIEWNIPFQGEYLPEDTQELVVLSLSTEDLAVIPYFSELKTVHANGCRDYDALMTLSAEYPDLDVRYTVTVQNTEYNYGIDSLTFTNANTEDLYAAIPYLPNLKQVTFTENPPNNESIYQLMCEYPDIEFLWNLSILGIETPNTANELVFSGIPMESTAEVESYLKYFPNLERVEMCDCDIPSADMDALSKRWPKVRFVWTINVGRGRIRTDSVGFIPWKFGYDGNSPLYDKDVTELKYCVDMVCLDLGHMKITDVSFLENMPKLKYLIVGELPCPDFSPMTNLKELIYLEIFNTTFHHQEILLELPKLQDLNLGSTKVYGTEVLKQMTWLKRLWLAGTGLSYAEYDELVTALPDTQVVMHIPHSTAGGWRDHQNYRDMRDLLGMFYME